MVNVIPQNDEREHERSTTCWCGPRVVWRDAQTGEIYRNGPLIVHNSADHREFVERLLHEGCGANQRWAVIEN